ncbi:MAG: primosomal protein N', partial [Gammaproteobacteria bacterium]|nr:primosomal protein N' [Gammaproteobacteria bacterium]
MAEPILRVAVPSPLYRLFDYLPPRGESGALEPGMRVQIPFGRGRSVGVLVEIARTTDFDPAKLKRVQAVLDTTPILPDDILAMARWAAEYYHHPLGEVLAGCLPVVLRRGQPLQPQGESVWRLTAAARAASPAERARAPQQDRALTFLAEHVDGASREQLDAAGFGGHILRALAARGWIESAVRTPTARATPQTATPAHPLNPAQADAVAAIQSARDRYQAFLLDGVTGSGKTEVYLQAIADCIAQGKQALVVVPEIGLTPQLIERFQQRLGQTPALLHSALSEGERLNAWLAARAGEAAVILGTRSAAWVPLARPGLFIVDEEHDASLKQQDGFRYSARDLLVWRAHRDGVPIVLGSATPALESLHNAQQSRYQHLSLPERAGLACAPRLHLLDIRNQTLDEGLSPALLAHMRAHLGRDGQVLLFLNRRGFAPTLLCHACGWVAECRRCDAHLTLHQRQQHLRCHHCGSQQPIPVQCPHCGCADLRPLGAGTERVEKALERQFPGIPFVRIDRDSTRRKGRLEDLLAQAASGEARILLGTQMLAKGHHFPGVTLVGILEADQGLFSADFRAGERLAQQVIQVAGRSGRAERPGEVLIQTHHPEHPLLQQLVEAGYPAFAAAALVERQAAGLPPFSNLALLRAEATDARAPERFLSEARDAVDAKLIAGLEFWGPVPSPMERRAGRFRAQLLLVARDRKRLHRLLTNWVPRLGELKSARKVRWSLDVDPIDL